MLLHISNRGNVEKLPGRAHIVISLDDHGAAFMHAYCLGSIDSTYFSMPDDRLFQREVPKLVDELRAQIQGASGPAVTE